MIKQPHEAIYEAFAYEAITVADTAIGCTADTYNPTGEESASKRAILTCETAQIRYTYDGTTPTSTVGHVLNANDVLTLNGYGNIKRFKAIRTGSTSGALKVTYER